MSNPRSPRTVVVVRVLLAALAAAAASGRLVVAQGAAPSAAGGQAPVVTKVVAGMQTLALRSDGAVFGWGGWIRGALGKVAPEDRTQFGTRRPIPISLPGRAVDIAAANETSFALLEDGTLWAWGGNSRGTLGTGSMASLPLLSHSTSAMEYRGAEQPVKVPLQGVAKISANFDRVTALMTDGTVREWPTPGPDGSLDSRPKAVSGLTDIVQVAPGTGHTLALGKDGRVWAWGYNALGAVGVEPQNGTPITTPMVVAGLPPAAAVAAAADVSFVLGRDGTVWVWGSNGQGQFGNGDRTSHPTVGTVSTPQKVAGLATVVAISAGTGGRHVFALLKDGTLRGWGNTDWGQLGNGAGPGFVLRPVAIRIANVRSVFAVNNATFAVKTDGSFWGWGSGAREQWPFPQNVRVPTPVELR